ncbi:hypothetical protein JW823_02560 [bacterium]|nr:hypothetical protein [candidate division CSSED10-310 bacterium]
MTTRHGPGIVLGCLILMTLGAMGIALSGLPLWHVNSFQISIDDDSLRTEPLVEEMESLYGSWVPLTSPALIITKLSDLQQIERTTVRKAFTGSIYLDIITRKPVLKMSLSAEDPVCISPDGTPFPYRPEHGELPFYTVPEDWTRDRLLSPDTHIRATYALLLQLVSYPAKSLNKFNHLASDQAFDVILTRPDDQSSLRLSKNLTRTSESALKQIDSWIAVHSPDHDPCEYDARFPNMIIFRTLREVADNG